MEEARSASDFGTMEWEWERPGVDLDREIYILTQYHQTNEPEQRHLPLPCSEREWTNNATSPDTCSTHVTSAVEGGFKADDHNHNKMKVKKAKASRKKLFDSGIQTQCTYTPVPGTGSKISRLEEEKDDFETDRMTYCIAGEGDSALTVVVDTRNPHISTFIETSQCDDFATKLSVTEEAVTQQKVSEQTEEPNFEILRTSVIEEILDQLDKRIMPETSESFISDLNQTNMYESQTLLWSGRGKESLEELSQLCSESETDFREKMVDSPDLLNSLVSVLGETVDTNIQFCVAQMLTQFSKHADGIVAILHSNFVAPTILSLLNSSSQTVISLAIVLLETLSSHSKSFQSEVLREDCSIPAFLELISHLIAVGNKECEIELCVLINCLYQLSHNVECRVSMFACGGVKKVVRVLRKARLPKLVYTTCRLLNMLCETSFNRNSLIDAKGLSILEELLESNEMKIVNLTLCILLKLVIHLPMKVPHPEELYLAVEILKIRWQNDTDIQISCQNLIAAFGNILGHCQFRKVPVVLQTVQYMMVPPLCLSTGYNAMKEAYSKSDSEVDQTDDVIPNELSDVTIIQDTSFKTSAKNSGETRPTMTAPNSYMQPMDPGQMQPMMPKEQQISMWGQGQYVMDSGIHSGTNTAAPSVMSGASSLHDELVFEGNHPMTSYTPHQIDDINEQYNATRSQRIRAAMFPETLPDEGTDIPSTQYNMGQSTNVQHLSEPSQMLKTAVVNLINYQDDAELATRAIPELIRLLSDEDQVVVGNAAMMVHQLSKKDAPLRAMVANPELVNAVIKAMNATRDPDIEKFTTGTLYHMSQHSQGLLAIFRSGGIKTLVRLLGSSIDCVVFYAITTIHNLLLHQDGAKDIVRAEGGIEKMVQLLPKPLEKFLAILTDCLKILAFEHQESKLRILQCGGPAKLVDVMRKFNYEKLLWTTSRVLKVLSVCSQNKPSIVQAGGMQAMTPHLNHPSQRLVKSCLFTLRNLSDAATKEENIKDLLLSLTRLLGSSDIEVVTCCAGILSNLTCNNQRNKITLCSNGVIEALIRTLQVHGGNSEEVAEPCLCTLRHLTWRHPNAEAAQNDVRLYNGLVVVVQFLRTPRAPLVKAALGLVRHLANNPANQQPLREWEAVQLCGNALQSTFAELEQARMMQQPIPVYDGVSVMDIVESASMALHIFAKDDTNRKIILQMNLTQIFVRLLSFENESVQRVAAGVLCEISFDREGATTIEREGSAIASLTELLHSRNQNIASYAGQTLWNIGTDKPEEYRTRLDLEMSTVLNRHDSAPWAQDGINEMQSMPDEPFNDMMYQQAFDPSLSMGQMQLGSPAGPWNPQDVHGGMYAAPAPPPPPARPQLPPTSQPGGGWYDTDL